MVKFFKSERGAATIDFIVLCGATVVFATTVLITFLDGASEHGNVIRDNIVNRTEALRDEN